MSVLILLVGRNPLPNWVVFRSLASTNAPREWRPEAIRLVHSTDTAETAEWLRQAISAVGVPAQKCELDQPRDGVRIRRVMQQEIAQLGRSTAVHLNYTGGTKEMAVSVYAECDAASRDGRLRAVQTSYLDAGEHRLRFGSGDVWPESLDLRQCVSISLEELLAMHGRRLETAEERTNAPPPWLQTAQAIWNLREAGEDAGPAYQAWLQRRGVADGDEATGRKGDFAIVLPTDQALAPLAEAIRGDLEIPSSQSTVAWAELYAYYGASNKGGRRKVRDEKVPTFFGGGGWLEVWLWQQLHRLVRQGAGWPLHHSVYARSALGGKSNAELDIVLLCGYQLFVFSCTTDRDRGRCKGKAFEVIHRAQQYGGEEARPVLVAPLTVGEVDDLRADLASDFGSAENLRIWGIEEMRQLDQAWDQMLTQEGLR